MKSGVSIRFVEKPVHQAAPLTRRMPAARSEPSALLKLFYTAALEN